MAADIGFKRITFLPAEFKCQDCGREFSSEERYNNHMLVHDPTFKTFLCHTCGKGFVTAARLKKHGLVHSDNKPVACSFCDKRFKEGGALSRHIRSRHTKYRPYKCEVCGDSFTVAGILKVHMRIHTGERPYQCQTCGDRFTISGALKVHMRTHTGERPYHCQFCPKRFINRGHLQNHVTMHNVAQVNNCNQSSETTGSLEAPNGQGCQSSAYRHKRSTVNTIEKDYLCPTCGKVFGQVSALKNHLKIHQKEWPYQCAVCGRTFKQYGALRIHCRTHTRKNYTCGICGKQFIHTGAYTRHKFGHTQNKVESNSYRQIKSHLASSSPDLTDVSTTNANDQVSGTLKQNVPFIEDGPCTCMVCNEEFCNIFELQNHLSSHTQTESLAHQKEDMEIQSHPPQLLDKTTQQTSFNMRESLKENYPCQIINLAVKGNEHVALASLGTSAFSAVQVQAGTNGITLEGKEVSEPIMQTPIPGLTSACPSPAKYILHSSNLSFALRSPKIECENDIGDEQSKDVLLQATAYDASGDLKPIEGTCQSAKAAESNDCSVALDLSCCGKNSSIAHNYRNMDINNRNAEYVWACDYTSCKNGKTDLEMHIGNTLISKEDFDRALAQYLEEMGYECTQIKEESSWDGKREMTKTDYCMDNCKSVYEFEQPTLKASLAIMTTENRIGKGFNRSVKEDEFMLIDLSSKSQNKCATMGHNGFDQVDKLLSEQPLDLRLSKNNLNLVSSSWPKQC